MGLLLQTIYNSIFRYFCLPVFMLMLIGRPRFLIKWVHKLINMREPFFNLKLFRFIFFLCSVTVIWSYYRKWDIERMIERMSNEAGGTSQTNIHFIDDKLREAHLFERNSYMFFTFIVLMIIVEKFCHSYFKLWALQDEQKSREKTTLKQEFIPEKELLLKKTE